MDGLFFSSTTSKIWEYGGLVTVLLIFAIASGRLIMILIKRNDSLADKMLDVIGKNTEALTKLTEKIDEHDRYH